MTISAPLRVRTASPVLSSLDTSAPTDRSVRRRLGWIWGLLIVNVFTFTSVPLVVPIPSVLGKLITQGALVVALALALILNRRLVIRPNGFLLLYSVLCGLTVLMSIHGHFGLGSLVRTGRLVGFLLVLWLLSPWWGREDLFFARTYRRALAIVLASVVLGLALSPRKAFAQAGGGRLGGAIWPFPPTQVAHVAAVFVGLTVVMWFTGLLSRRSAAIGTLAGLAILLLTHTRTAIVAMLIGILVAGLSLVFSRKRVRRAFAVALVIGLLLALSFAPFLSHWFERGENSQELSNFTGRTVVWTQVIHQQRSEVNTLFGYGMSNDSFNGLPIDSTWLSIYVDQGLVGDVLVAAAVLLLLLIALLAPRGPARAIALFFIVFCLISSYLETGLGTPSPYLLELVAAMSLLVPASPARTRLGSGGLIRGPVAVD
jgi:O-antigen ligase